MVTFILVLGVLEGELGALAGVGRNRNLGKPKAVLSTGTAFYFALSK
jgi:hypothetical protein